MSRIRILCGRRRGYRRRRDRRRSAGPALLSGRSAPQRARAAAVSEAQRRALSALLETIDNTFKTTGQRHPANGVIAQGVNTLGEVMDGDWYVNRHGTRRMTLGRIAARPGPRPAARLDVALAACSSSSHSASTRACWSPTASATSISSASIRSATEGLATGAQMVASQFFYALGYHVAENYIVRFDRARLVVDETGQAVSSAGHARALAADDIDRFLKAVPEGKARTYRAVATRLPEVRGALLGPYQMWGTRSDDPNDTVLHEHRRDLRGMFVFAAWLNVSNVRAVSTQDILATVDGVPRIRHYVVGPHQVARQRHVRRPEAGMGRQRAGAPAAGRGRQEHRQPWTGDARVDAREELRSAGSRQVRQQHLRPRVVDAGRSAAPVRRIACRTTRSGPRGRSWRSPTRTSARSCRPANTASRQRTGSPRRSIERRNRIGRAYFARVLPLDHIRVDGNALAFDDLGVTNGFAQPRTYTTTGTGSTTRSGALLETIGTGAEVPGGARRSLTARTWRPVFTPAPSR